MIDLSKGGFEIKPSEEWLNSLPEVREWFKLVNEEMRRLKIMEIIDIAKTCHEVNRAYCLSLGDESQVKWDNAPDWQKDSAVQGVEFHLENHMSTPESSHKSWLDHKAKEGWKFGPLKDAEKKEHPCFVPFNQLPTEQRAKDFIFLAVVRSLQGFLKNVSHAPNSNDNNENGGGGGSGEENGNSQSENEE